MKFDEAFKLLEQGKRVRRKAWDASMYFQRNADIIVDDDRVAMRSDACCWFADDWEEYRNPVDVLAEKLCNTYQKYIGSGSDWSHHTPIGRDGWRAVARAAVTP